MDLKHTRIERLTRFAKSRGVLGDPTALGVLIGKKPNQVYNLLSGQASFGEKVARSIEEAAGLPRGWLDAEDFLQPGLLPEVAKLAQTINDLPAEQRRFVIETTKLTISHAPLLARPSTIETAKPELKEAPSPVRERKAR